MTVDLDAPRWPRILHHIDDTYAAREEAFANLRPGWELKLTVDRPDRVAYRKAHQDWMECMMAFWPEVREEINKALAWDRMYEDGDVRTREAMDQRLSQVSE